MRNRRRIRRCRCWSPPIRTPPTRASPRCCTPILRCIPAFIRRRRVAAGASVDPTAEIAAQAFIGEGARIGARCFIGPGSVIERDAVIGDDARFVARVFVGHDVVFGKRCIVQPGAVIGGDGFGFAPEKRHLGQGAAGRRRASWVTTSRSAPTPPSTAGRIDDTVIEEGVKLDNLIMIAHNVRIGAHSAMAALRRRSPAAAWSASDACSAARSALTGHVTLCDDVVVLGTSFISHSIDKPGVYSSALPSEEAGAWRRIVGRIKRLDAMARRLRAVEKHVGFSAHRQGFFRGLTK